MTDTTDIAALHSKAANVIGLLTAESLTGGFALDSLADVFDDMFRLLEAERQRADDAHKYGSERDSENESLMLTVGRLRVEIAALKGEQVPVAAGTTEKCSPDVYAKGVSACLIDIPKEKAEVICRCISAASGVAVDWHYVGGRVHIKAMRVTAPQKPVVLRPSLHPSHSYASVAVSGRDEQWYAAIEAAGGIVKDGE